MKTHDIDSIFKKTVDESANFYDIEANQAKGRIWKHVQTQKENRPSLVLIRLLAAACILLLISTSVATLSFIKAKRSMRTLVEANNTLMKNATASPPNSFAVKEPMTAARSNSTDTIYIEKKVVVSKPVLKTIQVVDTVYVKQIEYVEKEHSPELLTANEHSLVPDSQGQKKEKLYETEILIRNNESIKPKKRKKLQLKFGGNNNPTNNGTLAFTTKL